MNELQKALNTLEIGFLEGTVSREVIEKARAQADELMKGGEGSRGGKIIGHTKSGKPIYEGGEHHKTMQAYHNFSSDNHIAHAKRIRQNIAKMKKEDEGKSSGQKTSIHQKELEHKAKIHEDIAHIKSNMSKSIEDDLEKGKSMPIGTIHNGFKKIAEGKWRKVSESGKTKEEHEEKAKLNKWAKHYTGKTKEEHEEAASKLDSKEYSDVEVHGKEENIKFEDGVAEYSDINKWKSDVKKLYPDYKILKGKGYGGENSWDVVPNEKSDFQSEVVATFDNDEKFGQIFEPELKNKDAKKPISPDLQKAILTLELGHLLNQVSADTLEKARSKTGTYANTYNNRKAGLVGRPYENR